MTNQDLQNGQPKQTVSNVKKSKASIWNWRIDGDELNKQISGYDTLSPFEAKRKRSALLLVLSAALGIVLNLWLHLYDPTGVYIEVVIFLILAGFIWKGSRVALIIAMIGWTIEKGFQLIGVFTAGTPSGFQGYIAIVWWAWYMSEFVVAYQVENAKRTHK